MILQALNDYYQRKADDPESGIAPEGFEWKELPFLIVIDREGKFVTLEDTREGEGKKKRARARLVPAAEKRTVGIKANLLWDNIEYAIGANPRARKDVADRHADFLRRLREELPSKEESSEIAALWTFLEASPIEQIEASPESAQAWKEILETNAFVTFRIDGEFATLCDHFRPWIQSRHVAGDEGSICLVTGKRAVTARLHAPIKGIYDGQSSGGAIVSFNLSAFTSFGKSQNHNAPVSEAAAFAYTTALATLLGKDSRNKLRVGDATTVFWADRPNAFEEEFPSFFTMAPKDDPDRDALVVKNLYESAILNRGASDSSTRFFVLGLAPNAARISVRFWQTGTVAEFSGKIRQHYEDLEIVRAPKDLGKYSLFWYLVDIATERKADNIPPNLAGNITRAILDGSPYPATLLQQTVRRIRAEEEVTRIRASLLKAYLNRYQRTYPSNEKEILVALDPANTSPGYLLGRLFAVLEKIQEDAQPGINATIRERFYGAASASPVTVFPQLLKLKNHHLAKMESHSFRIGHEKRLTEIVGNLPPEMPRHLRIEDQARFAIGYYHQRQALFTKSDKTETPAKDA